MPGWCCDSRPMCLFFSLSLLLMTSIFSNRDFRQNFSGSWRKGMEAWDIMLCFFFFFAGNYKQVWETVLWSTQLSAHKPKSPVLTCSREASAMEGQCPGDLSSYLFLSSPPLLMSLCQENGVSIYKQNSSRVCFKWQWSTRNGQAEPGQKSFVHYAADLGFFILDTRRHRKMFSRRVQGQTQFNSQGCSNTYKHYSLETRLETGSEGAEVRFVPCQWPGHEEDISRVTLRLMDSARGREKFGLGMPIDIQVGATHLV